MEPADLLSSAEACERLAIDRSTLSRWVASGRIEPALKSPGVRGPFVFTATEIERVQADLTTEATA